MSTRQATNNLLKNKPPVYVAFAFNSRKAILMYCGRGCLEFLLYSSGLKRNWNRGSEQKREPGIRGEDEALFAPLVSFS